MTSASFVAALLLAQPPIADPAPAANDKAVEEHTEQATERAEHVTEHEAHATKHAENAAKHAAKPAAPHGPTCACAQGTTPPDQPWAELHLQVRPRTEKAFVGHIGVPRFPYELSGADNFRTTSRIRLSGEGGVGIARARVSVQDVRTWGSESGTLTDFSADNVDFHEGWVQIGTDNMLRLGRQEIVLDGQRLIGAVNWQQQARAFDAALLKHGDEHHEVTLFATRVADGFTHDLFVAHGMVMVSDVRLAVPLIFQTNAMIAAENRGSQPDDWHRFTGGVHASSDGDLFWRAEAYLQTGTNHFATMFGGRAGLKLNAMLKPMLWIDYLSGDNDLTDAETGAFDTLFATNHKFYGYMDRFLAVPAHTRGGGLIDLAIKNEGELGPGKLEVALHEFMLASADVSPAATDDHSRLIGFEADLVYALPLSKWLKVVAGASLFVDQGDFRDERREVSESAPTVHDWFFVMVDMNI